MSLIDVLGLDPKDVEWEDLALCNGAPVNWFFDEYESDPKIAKQVDSMCAVCPVRVQCLRAGIQNGDHGVHGGVYLNGSGGVDKQRIGHKSPEEQERLRAL